MLQVSSSTQRPEPEPRNWNTPASLVLLALLLRPFPVCAAAESLQGTDIPASIAYRFEVTDSETGAPVAGADISVDYLRETGTAEARTELKRKTDKNGLVEFPRLNARKVMATVAAKGYRSHWQWIDREGAKA